jgi:hypothetical protein
MDSNYQKGSQKKSSRDEAIAFLKKEQRASLKARFGESYLRKFHRVKKDRGGILDFHANQFFKEEEMEEVRAHMEELKQNSRVLSTEYEIFQSSQIIAGLCPDIETTISRLGYDIKEEVFFGVVSSGEYNALADRVPESDAFILLFEDELFTLCNQLSKIIIQGLPDFKITDSSYTFNSKAQIIKTFCDSNQALQKRFDELAVYGILHGKPTYTPQYKLDERYEPFHYPLLRSIELFIVGHEYGHVLAGHLHNQATLRIGAITQDTKPDFDAWDQEFEADARGFELMINTAERDHFPFSYLGAELFFIFLDLDERVNSLWYDGTEKISAGTRYHPPSRDRRNHIIKLAKSVLPPDWLEVYMAMSNGMSDIVESLWENLKLKLDAYRKLPVQP